ncbi:MAG TPA: IS110 family transposase [Herpetosiphonaceae bacterium]|nr:IS110 family transposase [Herpetosiphonaceae bacterium]
MDLLYPACAGLDVHKKTVVVCCRIVDPAGTVTKETRTFSTVTADLLSLSDWLTTLGITHVAMESTGEFWKPLYNLLEGSFTILVVNAQHMHNVPGRKTDVKDAEWIADLLAHGLLRSSFIPPEPQRDLRDLTRQRTILVRERAEVVRRLQKVLEWANLKLASVATDVAGRSARAMLEAIVDGQSDVTALAELARGRMRSKRAELERALAGRVRDHHRFLIAKHLLHIDFLDEQIDDFDTQIAAHIQTQPPLPPVLPPQEGTRLDVGMAAARPGTAAPTPPPGHDEAPAAPAPLLWEDAITIWDGIPGIGRRVAEQLVAELGVDMGQFPSAAHAASWAKLSPGQHVSAGKRYSSRIGKGNQWLRSTLIQAAHAAVKVKDSYLAAFYHRLVARRGVKKAIVAVAHKLLILAYTLLRKRAPYQERGAAALDERRKDHVVQRMQRRFEQLGYKVHLEPIASMAA